ncbi:DASH complex subunit Dad2-domain-containing protein, partial [Glomus cerebriforme]
LLTQKIQEKQQEYDNLLILKNTSQNLSDYFDQLADNIEELNSGCEAVATILRNWQTVFRTILLAEETPKSNVPESQMPVVVRIPMKPAETGSK